MARTLCPSQDRIRAYLLGMLGDDEAGQLDQHFEACPECQAAADELESASDDLDALVRAVVREGVDPAEVDGVWPVAAAKACGAEPWEAAPGPAAGAASEAPLLPRQVGPYQLLECIGRGGMGAVYRARHERLGKIVAVKVLTPDRLKDRGAVDRFRREWEAIANLDHPHIVGATDAGEDAGVHYLAMAFVDGCDSSRIVRRLGPLPVAEACEIGRQAALGLQYLFEQKRVHRDVSPSNIMLRSEGSVVLLDLGLALLKEPQAEDLRLTAAGQLMGTYDYMAPEQIQDCRKIDVRADLYSLGCTLYRLLCGRAPFDDPEHSTALQKIIGHREHRPLPLCDLRPDVPEELAAIVHRLLEKKPEDRFGTPIQVAAVIAPFAAGADLAGLAARARQAAPVEATAGQPPSMDSEAWASGLASTERSPSRSEGPRKSRLWSRRRVLAAAGILLVVLGLVALSQAFRRNPSASYPPGAEADAITQSPPPAAILVPPGGGHPTTSFTAPEMGSGVSGVYPFLTRSEPHDTLAGDFVGVTTAIPFPTRGLPPARKTLAAPIDPMWLNPPDRVTCRQCWIMSPAKIVGVATWGIESRGHRGRVLQVAYSPDGKWLASISDGDPTIRLWHADSLELRSIISAPYATGPVAWSASSRWIARAATEGIVFVWEVISGRVLRGLAGEGTSVRALAWSPDSAQLAIAHEGGAVRLWSPQTGTEPRVFSHKNAVGLVRWSPDGKMLLCVQTNGEIVRWEVSSGKQVARIPQDGAELLELDADASPDGRKLALFRVVSRVEYPSGEGERQSKTRQFIIVDSADGTLVFHGQVDPHFRRLAVAFSPDGQTFASHMSGDPALHVVAPQSGKTLHLLSGARDCYTQPAWSPDGQRLAAGGRSGAITVWRASGGDPVASIHGSLREEQTVRWSRDGRKPVASGTPLLPLRALAEGWVAVSPTTGQIAVLEYEGPSVALYTLARPTESMPSLPVRVRGSVFQQPGYRYPPPPPNDAWKVMHLKGNSGVVWTTDFSRDGSRLATLDDDRTVRVWGAGSGELLHVLGPHTAPIGLVRWSPDGTMLVVAAVEHRQEARASKSAPVNILIHPSVCHLWLWHAASGKLMQTIRREFRPTLPTITFCPPGSRKAPDSLPLAFSPDGRRVTIALQQTRSDEKSVRDYSTMAIFDTASGKELRTIEQKAGLDAIAWLPNGRAIALHTARDQALRILDADTGEVTKETQQMPAGVFGSDGTTYSYLEPDGTVRVLDTLSGELQQTIVYLPNDRWLAISPEGHWCGSPGVENDILYVAETEQGQETITPAEFAKKYGWKNDPSKVTLPAEPSGQRPERTEQCPTNTHQPKLAEVAVSGRVTCNGQPLVNATVSFVPTGATRGERRFGTTDQDGRYSLRLKGAAGVPAGQYRVVISKLVMPNGSDAPGDPDVAPIASQARETLPPHYSSEQHSMLLATVGEGGGSFDFVVQRPDR